MTTTQGSGAASAQLERVRALCLALPRATERPSHGGPAFFADPRCFVMFLDDHHGDGRLALWCAAPEGVQAEQVALEPDRFFRPPYVGHRGWLGVLPATLDDDELAAVVLDAYRCTASARARRELDARPG
ncbi:MmcQ/YjbR family DNA-binding protein [Microlunatus capsulatus]|uniref:MmcQ/YjbR family DNA-binding protein n=1 Tax=Microlunatus capsulatus TaxID=99117 RepID=A0ABS4Z5I2_9ACTN|nr:MmcQ/YjbR family DNA-binding protein [Microlunatus capsulatus]MBP2416304.1 hypothetical protein [Microlunatus capsulatus]